MGRAKFGEDADSEDEEDGEGTVEKDGVLWTIARGLPPTISQLEDHLSDVKALYRAKFGEDVDSEDREDDKDTVEKDGVVWTIARGAPPTISQLEDCLSDVKALYRAKFGVDADSKDDEDGEGTVEKDGVVWTIARGAPPTISQLEDCLADVKALYRAKFGEDADSEDGEDDKDTVESDGVVWTVARGAPPTILQLEDSLWDVKAMYRAKFGEDADSEDREDTEGNAEKDGVMWTVVRGTPPTMSQLEEYISDIKDLYKARFGEDVDSEDTEDNAGKVEKDGIMWTVSRDAPPSISQLEDRLVDVKTLYEAKYGKSFDVEEEEGMTA